jgi:hypothetical protein
LPWRIFSCDRKSNGSSPLLAVLFAAQAVRHYAGYVPHAATVIASLICLTWEGSPPSPQLPAAHCEGWCKSEQLIKWSPHLLLAFASPLLRISVYTHMKHLNITIDSRICCFVWVWNLVSYLKRTKQTEGVWEQGAVGSIWTQEGWSDTRLKECIMSFIICTLHQILLRWSNQGG